MISKERLVKEQKNTGYRQEIIEKVVWLMHVLSAISEDSYLKHRLALKGGTALNLFYFPLPRLSVDADFNYIGAISIDDMLKERPIVEERIKKLLQRLGLTLIRNSQVHAGGKMTWRYASALGNQSTIEIDINFMYRVPLLPVHTKESIVLADQKIHQLQLLDFHEIAAGKLTALVDRGAGRDLFDAFHIFNHPTLDIQQLRLLFVVYAAMSHKKNFLDLHVQAITADSINIKNKLFPVLKDDMYDSFHATKAWVDELTRSVQGYFEQLLPFTQQERDFILSIQHNKKINPENITDDSLLIMTIKSHPALLWAIKK